MYITLLINKKKKKNRLHIIFNTYLPIMFLIVLITFKPMNIVYIKCILNN